MSKMMKFTIGDKEYTFFNRWGDSRSGFNHFTELFVGDNCIAESKVHYINRTWESYQFQSVMIDAVDNLIKDREDSVLMLESARTGRKRWRKEEKQKLFDVDPRIAEYRLLRRMVREHREESGFGALAAIMALGDILCDDPKESNDWKERMLKAGTPEGALMFPDDWKNLPEEERARRLNGAADALR